MLNNSDSKDSVPFTIPKEKVKSVFKEYLNISFGILLVAIGIYFFKFPNNFSTGGVAGISVIVNKYLSGYSSWISASTLMTIMNMLLLVVGFGFIGRDFGFKTVYSTLLLSGITDLFDYFYPMEKPLTNQPFLELCFAVALPAIGSAILFYEHASSGGTDIIAMIIRKHTNIESGRALFCSDFVITIASFIAFGPETGLFSILGLGLKSLVVDNAMENINQSKYFLIITTERAKVEEFITKNLHRSATVWQCEGSFTHQGRFAMVSIMKRYQAYKLRGYIKSVDPHAFIIISNTSDIIGKGFHQQ